MLQDEELEAPRPIRSPEYIVAKRKFQCFNTATLGLFNHFARKIFHDSIFTRWRLCRNFLNKTPILKRTRMRFFSTTPSFLKTIFFSDEIHFHLCGSVSKENMRYSADTKLWKLHRVNSDWLHNFFFHGDDLETHGFNTTLQRHTPQDGCFEEILPTAPHFN